LRFGNGAIPKSRTTKALDGPWKFAQFPGKLLLFLLSTKKQKTPNAYLVEKMAGKFKSSIFLKNVRMGTSSSIYDYILSNFVNKKPIRCYVTFPIFLPNPF